MITLKQQIRLRKFIIKRILRNIRREKFNHYILKWTKIRKQKDRRRRRTLIKLYKLERLKYFNMQRSA